MLAVALALLFGQGGSEALSPESNRAQEAWAMCTGLSAYSQVRNPQTPAEVLEIALRQCGHAEKTLRTALRRQFTRSSVEQTIESPRQFAREELAKRVAEARRGASQGK